MNLVLNKTQLEMIESLGKAKKYAAMYSYIATEMKTGRIKGCII
jgi:hypothetical protein